MHRDSMHAEVRRAIATGYALARSVVAAVGPLLSFKSERGELSYCGNLQMPALHRRHLAAETTST